MEFEVSLEELKAAQANAGHNSGLILRGLIAIVERQDYLIQMADTKTPKKTSKASIDE